MNPPSARGLDRSRGRAILWWVSSALFVAYPIVVWFGLQQREPRHVALVLLLIVTPLLFFGFRGSRSGLRRFAILPGCTAVALVAAAYLNDRGFVLATPSMVSGVLLVTFGLTLRPRAMPMIERFARVKEPELTAEKRSWCRTWTWIWCGFFVLNGSVAAWLAVVDLWWWALYASALSYVLIGLLLLTEWLLRRRRFALG